MCFFSVFITLSLVNCRFVRLSALFFVAAVTAALLLARPARAEMVVPADAAGAPAPLIEGDDVEPPALAFDQGKFYVLDPLNNRIIVQDRQTGERQDIFLPDGYFADMVVNAQTIYLVDFNRPGVLALDENNGQVIGAKSTLGLASELTSGPGVTTTALSMLPDLAVETQRTDDHQGWMTITGANKALLAILPIQSPYYLGSAHLLGRDTAGNYYVMVEELLEDVPEILVDTSVRRYAPDGSLLDAALLPMEEVDYFPNRPVAIDPDGGAYFLKVTQNRADIIRLDFNPGAPSTLDRRGEAVQPAQSTNGAQVKPVKGAPMITRQQIIQNAKSYLNVNWTLSKSNYHGGQSDSWNYCAANKGSWRLPRTLTGRVGQTIAGVPYAWGGYQSVADFQRLIKSGGWAGNICVNKVLSNVAGVDCAGFVSQALQAGAYYLAHITGLGRISTPINWSQLGPGDLLLKSGSHVALFDAFANLRTLDGGVWVYESTMRNGADRVGHNLVSFSVLSTYSTRRYNNLVETPAPANRNLIRNGNFDAGAAQWSFWGEIDVDARNGLMYFRRRSPSPTGAAVTQEINAVAEAGDPFEVTADLGNSSQVDKQVTLTLHNPNVWTGALTCPFTIPANSEPRVYRLAGVLPARWENTLLEIGVGSADGQPDLILDNVSVVYRPVLQPAGVECSAGAAPAAAVAAATPFKPGEGWMNIPTERGPNAR